ncbi:MAG: phosphate ABC transporter substrate-binding protein [Spirochaetaceae bacterium]|jgi:phosphate transport system substrate-binding protein|nr:phosphate ABC transporter substrate-binding protein [Spirochaetaceae bacterium]
MKQSIFLAVMGLALTVVAFARGKTDSSYTIEAAGSTSVTPLMELLAADYSALNPAVKVNINGTGSSDGIKAAAAGTSELGMSSRELSASEKGQGLTELVIAIDGIAVIVNKNNPIGNLTLEQIRDIYTGAITDWAPLSGGAKSGALAVVSREPGSGTRAAFEEIVQFQDRMRAGATEFDGTGAVKAEVSRNVDAIGYISLGSVDTSVKALSIEGISPSTDAVVNGTYKIARPFILLFKEQSIAQETKDFLDWILSDGGQTIVKKSWISVR